MNKTITQISIINASSVSVSFSDGFIATLNVGDTVDLSKVFVPTVAVEVAPVVETPVAPVEVAPVVESTPAPADTPVVA